MCRRIPCFLPLWLDLIRWSCLFLTDCWSCRTFSPCLQNIVKDFQFGQRRGLIMTAHWRRCLRRIRCRRWMRLAISLRWKPWRRGFCLSMWKIRKRVNCLVLKRRIGCRKPKLWKLMRQHAEVWSCSIRQRRAASACFGFWIEP